MDEREKQEQRFEQVVQEKKEEEAQAKAEEQKLRADERKQGDIDPRTKNSGHGQVTADKWNQ